MVPKSSLVLNGVTLAILGIRGAERDSRIVRLCAAGESDKQPCLPSVSLLQKHISAHFISFQGISKHNVLIVAGWKDVTVAAWPGLSELKPKPLLQPDTKQHQTPLKSVLS